MSHLDAEFKKQPVPELRSLVSKQVRQAIHPTKFHGLNFLSSKGHKFTAQPVIHVIIAQRRQQTF